MMSRMSRLKVGARKAGAGPDGQLSQADAGTGDDDLAAAGGKGEGQAGVALQVGEDVLDGLAFEPFGTGADRVGPADGEVVGGEAAVGAGGDRARGACPGVGDDDGGTGNGIAALVGDGAADARSDLLGLGRLRQRDGGRKGRQAGGQEVLHLHGLLIPSFAMRRVRRITAGQVVTSAII